MPIKFTRKWNTTQHAADVRSFVRKTKNVNKQNLSVPVCIFGVSLMHIWRFVCMILLLFLFHLLAMALIYCRFAERLQFFFFFSVIHHCCRMCEWIFDIDTVYESCLHIKFKIFHGIFALLPFFIQTQIQSYQFVSICIVLNDFMEMKKTYTENREYKKNNK